MDEEQWFIGDFFDPKPGAKRSERKLASDSAAGQPAVETKRSTIRLKQPRIDELLPPLPTPKRRRVALSLDARAKVLQDQAVLSAILTFVGAGALFMSRYRTCKLWHKIFTTEKALWRHLHLTEDTPFVAPAEEIADAIGFAMRFDCLESLVVSCPQRAVFHGWQPEREALNLADVLVALRPRRLRSLLWLDAMDAGPRLVGSLAALLERLPQLQDCQMRLFRRGPEGYDRRALLRLGGRLRISGERKGECKVCQRAASMVTCGMSLVMLLLSNWLPC